MWTAPATYGCGVDIATSACSGRSPDRRTGARTGERYRVLPLGEPRRPRAVWDGVLRRAARRGGGRGEGEERHGAAPLDVRLPGANRSCVPPAPDDSRRVGGDAPPTPTGGAGRFPSRRPVPRISDAPRKENQGEAWDIASEWASTRRRADPMAGAGRRVLLSPDPRCSRPEPDEHLDVRAGLAYWPNYHYYRGHVMWDIETSRRPTASPGFQPNAARTPSSSSAARGREETTRPPRLSRVHRGKQLAAVHGICLSRCCGARASQPGCGVRIQSIPPRHARPGMGSEHAPACPRVCRRLGGEPGHRDPARVRDQAGRRRGERETGSGERGGSEGVGSRASGRARCRRRPRRPDRRRSRLSHCKHPNIPGPELDVILGVERFPSQNVVHLGGHGY